MRYYSLNIFLIDLKFNQDWYESVLLTSNTICFFKSLVISIRKSILKAIFVHAHKQNIDHCGKTTGALNFNKTLSLLCTLCFIRLVIPRHMHNMCMYMIFGLQKFHCSNKCWKLQKKIRNYLLSDVTRVFFNWKTLIPFAPAWIISTWILIWKTCLRDELVLHYPVNLKFNGAINKMNLGQLSH